MFGLTLQQMLTMFTLIALGYVLRKGKILPEGSDTTMARLETYIFTPAITLSSQLKYCNLNTFGEYSSLILYGGVLVLVAIGLAYPISRLFIRKADTDELAYQRNIYKYAATFGNYGFMGNFLILGMFGDEMLFKYMMFCFVVGIFCTAWGVYILVPKSSGQSAVKNIVKGLLSPPFIALLVGMTIGILDLSKYVPEFLINMFSSAGACQGPVAMVLAGVVIAGYNLKDILLEKKVYFISALRLIAIPALFMAILFAVKKFTSLPMPEETMLLALVCFGTPLGMNTIVYPATYGGDTKTGAAMTTISHILAVATIPLMYYLFIELL